MIFDLHLPIPKICAIELFDSYGFSFFSSHRSHLNPMLWYQLLGIEQQSLRTNRWEIRDARKNNHKSKNRNHTHTTQDLRGSANCAYVHGLLRLSLKINGGTDYKSFSLSLSLQVALSDSVNQQWRLQEIIYMITLTPRPIGPSLRSINKPQRQSPPKP